MFFFSLHVSSIISVLVCLYRSLFFLFSFLSFFISPFHYFSLFVALFLCMFFFCFSVFPGGHWFFCHILLSCLLLCFFFTRVFLSFVSILVLVVIDLFVVTVYFPLILCVSLS
jgi:hypothetical protein